MCVTELQRFHQSHFCRLQEFRDHGEVQTSRLGYMQGGAHVDAEHLARRRQAQLPEAGHEHVPGLVFFRCLQGMFAVGAAVPGRSYSALRAGRAVFPTGFAVSGPSAWHEVPEAEGPDPFFAELSNICWMVSFCRNCSPTG